MYRILFYAILFLNKISSLVENEWPLQIFVGVIHFLLNEMYTVSLSMNWS